MADPERIAARLDALWRIATGPGGGADRPAYSPAEAAAMRLVAGWSRELGLAPSIDACGNLWALPEDSTGPVVTTGSHVDTVPDGGRYDGALGTVLGLEIIADLQREPPSRARTRAGGSADGRDPVRPALLVCVAEEAPRFGAGTIGSRLLTGGLAPADLDALRDEHGLSAAAARGRYLDALADLPRVDPPPVARLRAHAEIHVALRFGPVELGIVTRVASPRRLEVVIDGESGHAGEVAMEERRDALAAAAELILAVETAARAEPLETVATVGTLTVTPGAVSTIPGRARLRIDIRSVESESLARLQAQIERAAAAIAERRGVALGVELTRAGEPVSMDERLVREALRIAAGAGIPARETWSGAGHDAQHIAALAPALLVFVPLHGGQSHTPQEGAAMTEILWAARVATDVLREPPPSLE